MKVTDDGFRRARPADLIGFACSAAPSWASSRLLPTHSWHSSRIQQDASELCVASTQLDDPRVRALLAVLQSSAYRQWLRDVPGATYATPAISAPSRAGC